MLILEDARDRPELFVWYGPLLKSGLLQFLDEHQIRVPEDLVELWAATGGGDIFETETILGPYPEQTWADSLLQVNKFQSSRGLPADYTLFAMGLLAAVRTRDQAYVVLDEGFAEQDSFSSLDQWYRSTIRAEYADSYDLRTV